MLSASSSVILGVVLIFSNSFIGIFLEINVLALPFSSTNTLTSSEFNGMPLYNILKR